MDLSVLGHLDVCIQDSWRSKTVDMLDRGENEWRQSGCVLLIWPEFVGPPDGGLLDLQLNEIYDFVMGPREDGIHRFSTVVC